MYILPLLASLLLGDFSYGPPAQVWIDLKDPQWLGELNGSLQYYTDVNHWVRIQCTTSYIPNPPLPPVPIYTTYNFSFSDSAVTYLWAGGNTLVVNTDRLNIIYVDGFETGQNEP
jgi:hypothetical protein